VVMALRTGVAFPVSDSVQSAPRSAVIGMSTAEAMRPTASIILSRGMTSPSG
jgi:hypothetical protein